MTGEGRSSRNERWGEELEAREMMGEGRSLRNESVMGGFSCQLNDRMTQSTNTHASVRRQNESRALHLYRMSNLGDKIS